MREALIHSWEYTQEKFIDIHLNIDTETEIELLHNHVTKAGFNCDSKIPHFSVTKQITIELETLRSKLLTQRVLKPDNTYIISNRKRLYYTYKVIISVQYFCQQTEQGSEVDTEC